VIEDTVVNDFLPYQKKVNFCNDRRLVEKYQVTDRSQPGIYVMNSDEANVIKSGAGDATANWIKGSTPDDANQWVDKFAAEAAAAVSANPLGSDPLEQTDCSQFTEVFGKFKKKLKKRL
jgi:hypothetical protein